MPSKITEVEIVGKIEQIETIAEGSSIHSLEQLRESHGPGRWRKLKGVAQVRLPDDTIWTAEVHWYEAHGIGKRGMKVKRRWLE